MDDIFISYSRKDKAFTARLHEALKARQREAWVDLEDIPPTAEWREKIKAGIEGARAFVFVLSPDSMASPECLKEVEHAAASHKRLIPVVCREVEAQAVPEALGCLNWISMREQDDFEKQVDTLLIAVDIDLEWVDVHTNLLEKATEWDHKGREKSLLLRGGELRKAETWQVESAEKEPKPTELMASFIVASRQGAIKRKNIITGLAAAIAIVMAGIAVYALLQRNIAINQANVARSHQLAVQSRDLLNSRLDLSLLLSVQACRFKLTAEAKSSLLAALQKSPLLLSFISNPAGPSADAAFSPDGTILAFPAGSDIVLWEVAHRRTVGKLLSKKKHNVRAIAFNPATGNLASAYGDNSITLWDLAQSKPLGEQLIGPQETITRLTFKSDGKILTASSKNKTTLWDVATRKIIKSDHIENNMSEKILTKVKALSPDGQILASAGDGFKIKLWETAKGKFLGELSGHKGWVNALTFSPDSHLLASASRDKTIIIWDLARQQAIESPLEGHWDEVRTMTFSPDSQLLVSAGYITIILWDLTTHHKLGEILNHREVTSVAFSPNGAKLASASDDGTIILWDISGRRALGSPLHKHQTGVTSVSFSPDSKILASGGRDKKIILWDVERGESSGGPLTDHEEIVKKLLFAPDGKTLFSIDVGETIRLWDVERHQPLEEPFCVQRQGLTSLALSPDGKLLALADKTGSIFFWDMLRREVLGRRSHGDRVRSMAFSPNGQLLASASYGTISLWDVASRKSLGEQLLGHKGWVETVAFSHNLQLLASGGMDKFIRLWDVANHRLIGEPLAGHKAAVTSVTFSPDDKLLASTGQDDTIRLWDVDIQSWLQQACLIVNRNLTKHEWRQYMGDLPYRKTCPNLPEPGEGKEVK